MNAPRIPFAWTGFYARAMGPWQALELTRFSAIMVARSCHLQVEAARALHLDHAGRDGQRQGDLP